MSIVIAGASGTRLLLVSTDVVGARVAQHHRAIDAAVAAGVELVAYVARADCAAVAAAVLTGGVRRDRPGAARRRGRRTDVVERLTGRAPATLGDVLTPAAVR